MGHAMTFNGLEYIKRLRPSRFGPETCYLATCSTAQREAVQFGTQSSTLLIATSGVASKRNVPFDTDAFLDSKGIERKRVDYARGETIFTQGDACDGVMYIQQGGVKLSVVSNAGRTAVVAMLGPGEFFGEASLAGQPIRPGTATAVTGSTILFIPNQTMIRLLRRQHAFSDRFIAHMLARNVRIEEDLIDQLCNSSEKRLARVLLLMAQYGTQSRPKPGVSQISQDTLAEMVGTTRSRVNLFMNKFKQLGFIDYEADTSGDVTIHRSLLSVVLHD
jgi:CRP-like cAMP-binding protein